MDRGRAGPRGLTNSHSHPLVSLFLTGTDTGVGKTYTAVSLLRLARAAGFRCAGMKPICCGDRQDAELLLAASSEGVTIEEVNPVWLKTPASPFSAALAEGVEVDVDVHRLIAAVALLRDRFDVVIVEGVGGWLVPIRRDYFVSDFAKAIGLPVVVVALNRLGCLNHTMLTTRSIAAHGLSCAGVALNVANGVATAATTTNAVVLSKIAGVPLLPELSRETSELPSEWREILLGGITSKPSRD